MIGLAHKSFGMRFGSSSREDILIDTTEGISIAQLLIPDLDDGVIERLACRAAARRIPLEQFLREVLSQAAGPTRAEMLAEADRSRAMTPKPLTTSSTDLIRADRDRR